MNIKNLNIKGDIFGGITSAIIALPLALAFGIASGLGAMSGLYGAILLCFFATLFGGTPTQISGPTGPMTVVVASMVLAHSNELHLVFFSIFLAGILQIVLGLLKVGQFVKYVPYPVISGFMSGIGIIIILLQINQLLGLEYSGAPVLAVLNIFKHFDNISLPSLILGGVTLAIIMFTPKKIAKFCPPPLLALIVGTLASIILKLDVQTIGAIPTALPSIHLPMIELSQVKIVLSIAFTLAVLGSIDSLLTSLVADSVTKTKHDSNKELIGQGLGNIAAALFGGLAGAGATMRTVVNVKAGGRTRLSGVVNSIFLVLVVLCLSGFVSKIPLTVLAAILLNVGFGIIDYKFIKVMSAAPKRDLAVMFTVLLITVLDDLIFAVGVGIVLSAVLFAIKSAQASSMEVNVPDNIIEEMNKDDVVVLNIRGDFFFGTATFLLPRLKNLVKYSNVIINCKDADTIDISAIFTLQDIVVRMQDSNTNVFVVVDNKKTAKKFLQLGFRDIMPCRNIRSKMSSVMKDIYKKRLTQNSKEILSV